MGGWLERHQEALRRAEAPPPAAVPPAASPERGLAAEVVLAFAAQRCVRDFRYWCERERLFGLYRAWQGAVRPGRPAPVREDFEQVLVAARWAWVPYPQAANGLICGLGLREDWPQRPGRKTGGQERAG